MRGKSARARMKLEANSVSDFLDHVNSLRARMWKGNERDPLANAWEPWFRGEAKADWPLRPKLYRDGRKPNAQLRTIEDEISRGVRQTGRWRGRPIADPTAAGRTSNGRGSPDVRQGIKL